MESWRQTLSQFLALFNNMAPSQRMTLVFVPLLTSGMASRLSLPSSVADNLPLAIYGCILVIAMLVAPHGIQGALRRILAYGRARWGNTPGGGQKGVVDWDDPAPDT